MIDEWESHLISQVTAVFIGAVGGGSLVLLGAVMIHRAGRFRTPGQPSYRSTPTVLFLRDFASELQPFAIETGLIRVTVEEFFADEVERSIGTPLAPADGHGIWGRPSNKAHLAGARLIHVLFALHQGWFRRLPEIVLQGLPVHPALDRRWSDVAARLTQAGYAPGPDPGPGAVVAFDDDGTATVLRRDVDRPYQYVSCIAQRLAEPAT